MTKDVNVVLINVIVKEIEMFVKTENFLNGVLFNDGLEMNDRINRVSLYTLRHSFGSLLSARRANAFVIKSLMNHSRIETTDRYVKVANSVAKQYIDLLL